MTEADQYDEIRRRVEKRYKKRQDLMIHIASYIVTNVMLWVIFHDTWVLWVTFGWGIGVVSNLIDYYNKYGPGAQRKEEAIQREIERERARLGYEKPKNDTHMRLTDDGELEEIVDDEDEEFSAEKPKRG